jgi:hypothetical protein
MTDIDVLLEWLFPPPTLSEIWRDAADNAFVVPPLNLSLPVSILPGLYSDHDVAKRFGVTRRTIQEWARVKGLRRSLDGVRWFFESEILELMTEGNGNCSNSISGGTPRIGMRGARSKKPPSTIALELLTEGKPKSSSLNSKTKSSNKRSVAPFPASKGSGRRP